MSTDSIRKQVTIAKWYYFRPPKPTNLDPLAANCGFGAIFRFFLTLFGSISKTHQYITAKKYTY